MASSRRACALDGGRIARASPRPCELPREAAVETPPGGAAPGTRRGIPASGLGGGKGDLVLCLRNHRLRPGKS